MLSAFISSVNASASAVTVCCEFRFSHSEFILRSICWNAVASSGGRKCSRCSTGQSSTRYLTRFRMLTCWCVDRYVASPRSARASGCGSSSNP